MRTSRRLLKQARRAVLVALLLSASINLLMLATPLYTLQVFETVVPTGSTATLVVLTAMVAGAIAALALIELCRDRILLRTGLWLDHVLGQHILENGLRAGVATAELQQDQRSLATLRGFIIGPGLAPLLDAPWIPVFMTTLVLLHPMIGMIGAVAALLLFMVAILHGLVTSRAQLEGVRALERSDRWWATVAGNAHQAGAHGLARGAGEQWELYNRQHIASSYALGKRTSFIRAVARTVRISAQIGVYGLGGWLVIRNDLAPGALVASAILLSRVLSPLEQLVGGLKQAQLALAAYRRLKSLAPDVPQMALGADDSPAAGHVQLRDVTFYHPLRKTPALRAIDLEIKPGECIGIIGPGGAGKSTLAAIIAGALSPTVGSAAMDGVPIAKWHHADAPAPIGYLADEPLLLDGTVHENIAGFRSASLISVASAAIRGGGHQLLSDLPMGYDTPIAVGGAGLSLRERRAVALARCLHARPKLVVLDEPEIGLDAQGVRALYRAIEGLKASGTGVVVATHDLRLLSATDRVVLLNDGAVQSIAKGSAYERRLTPRPAAVAGGQ